MKPLKAILHKIKEAVLNVIYPPKCLSCNQLVSSSGSLCSKCWQQLQFIRPPYCHICGSLSVIPDQPAQETFCLQCFKNPNASVTCRSVLAYNHICQNLLHNFKLRRHTEVKNLIAKWLYSCLQEQGWHDFDLIIPTPLHQSKIRYRGFNQVLIICQELQSLSKIRCINNLLIRHKNTKPQGRLNFKQRQQNVHNAFSVNPSKQELITGKRILLVDDLRTTGATLASCAEALRPFKPLEICALTLARTVM